MRIDLAGVFIPVTTPFAEHNGDLDNHGLRGNLDRWLDAPIRGLVVGGSTGEAVLLEREERIEAIRIARGAIRDDRLLVAGAGTESTRGTIRLIADAADSGADAVLVQPPAFYRGAMTPDALREHYDFDGHAVEVVELAGGWQILTRAAFAAAVERAHAAQRTPRLSAATYETLATIAYRQPVGRAEIEEIRGVNAGGVLRTLQERGLIEVVGRSEGLGRPLLYGTTPLFLELLGLSDLADLPRAEELTIALQPHHAEPEAGDDGQSLAMIEEV